MESAHTDSRIDKAIQLLQKNPSCTLRELASHCKISVSRLSHLFKQVTGGSVEEYRRNRRLQEAARVLVSTDMPIKEIAYQLGYQHTSSFVRAFKAGFEMSPSRYREHRVVRAAA
jgi:AraC family transcriptional regulator of arabinose operon